MSGDKGSLFQKQRRKLLRLLGLGSAALAASPVAAQIRVQQILNKTAQGPAPNYIVIKILRPEDLLSLELRYYNFDFTGKVLRRKAGAAYVVVIFQPQSMLEQAWLEDSGGLHTPTVPGKIMIGGESRLVFSIPDSINNIPLDLKELLAWEKYSIVVNDRAKEPPSRAVKTNTIPNKKLNAAQSKVRTKSTTKNVPPVRGATKDEKIVLSNMILDAGIRENTRIDSIVNIKQNLGALIQQMGAPAALETSIEVPMRVYLSPTKKAGWAHISKLSPDKGIIQEANEMFELWHTRLGVKTSSGVDETDLTSEERILRAIWADHANKDYKNLPGDDKPTYYVTPTSLTDRDRHQLVHESSNFIMGGFLPQPIKARKLFLTTLGAWMTSEFNVARKKLEAAEIIDKLSVLSWKHISTMAREHYVEIVHAGNIMPFGHEAVLVKITERKPHPGTGTAANFQREFVIITEPKKDFNYRNGSGKFLNFCFSRVEFITTVSPFLDKPRKPIASTTGTVDDDQFFIIAGGNQALFKIKAEDLDGNLVDLKLPLGFVSTVATGVSANIPKLIEGYNKTTLIDRDAKLHGQKFTLAPHQTNGCDTSFVSEEITFAVERSTDTDEPQGFLPTIVKAKIIEPSYQKLSGDGNPIEVSLVDDNNQGNVFAEIIVEKAMSFAKISDKTGGLASPNFNMSGLSKSAGAFGGNISDFKSATATAANFFAGGGGIPDPKLFGVFKLSDILSFGSDKSSYNLTQAVIDRLPKVPNLSTEQTADAFITSYVIKPELVKYPADGTSLAKICQFSPLDPGGFVIKTQVKTYKKNPTSPEFSSKASIENFDIKLIDGLINIHFNEISFKTDANMKADVVVSLPDPAMVFGPPLAFINSLNSLIPSDGFEDPPYLDVSATGIKCGYTLALPNLQLGAFTLSHLSLGAEVNLPFTGGPLTMTFRFCERQQPFTLTVLCIGGGGYFGIELDLNGIRMIEAALEGGVAASVDFGVASGSISIMLGIYFKMVFVDGAGSSELTGYVRMNGSVSVLGLITASIELYLGLTYLIDEEKVYGEASLKIEVEVVFFSVTVTIHTSKTFAGSGEDPNFQMALTERDWQEYCSAFAA